MNTAESLLQQLKDINKNVSESFIIRAKKFKENKMSINKEFLKYIRNFHMTEYHANTTKII